MSNSNLTKGYFVKNKQTQSGSIHLLAVILIVIALIGTLGFVYWQNFMKPAATTVSSSSKTISINPSTTEPIYFTYPATWTVERETTENISSDITILKGSDTIKIYSPTRATNVEISYSIHGWETGYGENASDSIISFESSSLNDHPTFSFVQSVYSIAGETNKYFYIAGLSSLSSDLLSKERDSNEINSELISIIPTRRLIRDDGGGTRAQLVARINKTSSIKQYPEDAASPYYYYVSTVEEINDFFATSEFATAKEILLSARLSE